MWDNTKSRRARMSSMAQQSTAIAMQDTAWLYNAPQFPNAIAWSPDDNLLAVAAGHSVVVCSPADVTGPRALAELQADAGALAPGCKPDDYESNLSLALACAAESRSHEQFAQQAREAGWRIAGSLTHECASAEQQRRRPLRLRCRQRQRLRQPHATARP